MDNFPGETIPTLVKSNFRKKKKRGGGMGGKCAG